jgi:hypothetical protein
MVGGEAMNQRGSVGIYFLFSAIVAAAAGYGAYHYIREHKSAFQSDEQASTSPTPKPKAPTPAPAPSPDPTTEAPMPPAPEVAAPTESPAIMAGRLAIDPTDSSESPSFGTAGVVGGIEKRAVDRRFRPHAEQLQTCYEHASSFDGSVRVTMEVQPNGKLAKVSLDNGDDGFQACVIAALNVSFSATKDGLPATIVEPIHFAER